MLVLLLLACSPDGKTRTADPGTPHDTTGPTDTAPDTTGDTTRDTAPDTTHDTAPGTDTAPCHAISCDDVGATCGTLDDGCASTLDCGACGAWQSCEANQCVTAACVPAEADSTDGGGRCDDLAQAWTARGINAGYYPFRVLADTVQYSGDYDGPAGVTFTRGASRAGVILQVIPAGSWVGLSSVGPYYDPTGTCLPSGECGDGDVAACSASSPPLRPGIAGFYWGYAYGGASHMQGWIYADPTKIQYAGDDPSHPCADGPADADYEVAEACGAPTTCTGTSRTCGDANRCDEGIDDCGSTACGAESGGALTPSAHRSTVTYPTDIHTCTTRTPPDPSVKCLANGSDADFFFVYPHGAYLYWAQNSTTKHWIHYGDTVQAYYHTRDAQGVLWDFIEVLTSGAPTLTPASDGAGAGGDCSSSNPSACTPCLDGGTCGWVQDVFLH